MLEYVRPIKNASSSPVQRAIRLMNASLYRLKNYDEALCLDICNRVRVEADAAYQLKRGVQQVAATGDPRMPQPRWQSVAYTSRACLVCGKSVEHVQLMCPRDTLFCHIDCHQSSPMQCPVCSKDMQLEPGKTVSLTDSLLGPSSNCPRTSSTAGTHDSTVDCSITPLTGDAECYANDTSEPRA